MFHYEVVFRDEIYFDVNSARGRVVAKSPSAAKMKVRNFYPNAITIAISAIGLEDDDSDGEWDI